MGKKSVGRGKLSVVNVGQECNYDMMDQKVVAFHSFNVVSFFTYMYLFSDVIFISKVHKI